MKKKKTTQEMETLELCASNQCCVQTGKEKNILVRHTVCIEEFPIVIHFIHHSTFPICVFVCDTRLNYNRGGWVRVMQR